MKFALNKKSNGKKPPVKSEGSNSTGSESPMDVNLLERLVKLMAANDLNTVDVRDGDKRVILKRGAAAPMVSAAIPAMHAVHAPATSASHAAQPAAAAEQENLTPIKSPMVGTFY